MEMKLYTSQHKKTIQLRIFFLMPTSRARRGTLRPRRPGPRTPKPEPDAVRRQQKTRRAAQTMVRRCVPCGPSDNTGLWNLTVSVPLGARAAGCRTVSVPLGAGQQAC